MRYGLRTLLVLVALLGVVLAVHKGRMTGAHRQSERIAQIRKLSPSAITQYEFAQDKNWAPGRKKYPVWAERWLGEDYLYSVDAFCIVQEANPDAIIEQAAQLPHLRLVKLPACQISDKSLEPLQQLGRLEWLELFSTPVSDDGMKTVATLKSLKILDLRGTKVTDACIPCITALPKLERLNVGDTAISAAGLEAIQKALPNCRIDTTTH